jgi:hypothetical protein
MIFRFQIDIGEDEFVDVGVGEGVGETAIGDAFEELIKAHGASIRFGRYRVTPDWLGDGSRWVAAVYGYLGFEIELGRDRPTRSEHRDRITGTGPRGVASASGAWGGPVFPADPGAAAPRTD